MWGPLFNGVGLAVGVVGALEDVQDATLSRVWRWVPTIKIAVGRGSSYPLLAV
jgi:hypothetical protein